MSVADVQHRRWRDDARANISSISDPDLQRAVAAEVAATFSLAERTADAHAAFERFAQSAEEATRHMEAIKSTSVEARLLNDVRPLSARVWDYLAGKVRLYRWRRKRAREG